MSVQVIMKDGRPEWAVLPYAEYEALLAKAEAAQSGDLPVAQASPAADESASGLKPEDRRQLRNSMMEQLKDVASISDAGSFHGAKVTAVMKAKGLDGNHVAREVGISPVYLKQIETGEREPSEPILRNIARALGVDVNELSGL
ncbi:helix-turn-helix domain-containing protein [Pseudomaricurvus sp.]|uniref:helix-turn-helix domain-containing protein n=1 Tax=Pseudomaricurvus sp. TaxID=2004510 RepID=UPI003F6BB795